MGFKKLKRDDRMDIAVKINDKLVEMGYVPDDTDTNNENEFRVMDMIHDILVDEKLYKKKKNKAKKYTYDDMKHCYIEASIEGGILEDTNGEIQREADIWLKKFNRDKF